MGLYSLIVLCLTTYCLNVTAVDEVLVTLPNGQIRGREITTATNKVIYGFQGIPYAEPPLGNLRFQAPQPLSEKWTGILDATKNREDCLNKGTEITSTESENCLYLNVYTPNLVSSNSSESELVPVMFWIYGGHFTSGTSSYSAYGPDYLVQEGVVVVTINYRLGVFGFLSTGDEVIPGNAALKDQHFALKWTHENIHLFGGDPDKITIFGESAGAASVAYHTVSEKSAGLFRAAIEQSGTCIGYWALEADQQGYNKQFVQNLATNLNITLDAILDNSTALLEFLVKQDAIDILTADSPITTINTLPVIEVPHEDAYITQSTYESLRHGNFNKVALMIGFNSEEYLLDVSFGGNDELALNEAKSYDQNLELLIPTDLILDEAVNRTEIGQLIKSIYLKEDQLFADHVGSSVQYGSDNFMTRASIKHAQLFTRFSNVHFYQFSYHGLLGMVQNLSIDGLMGHVAHTEELPYIFRMENDIGVNNTDLSKFSEQDRLVLARTTKLWTNFAKYLDPTPDGQDTELFQNVKWPVLKQRGFQYLDIGENLEVVKKYPRADHFHKWQTIYSTYGQRPFWTY